MARIISFISRKGGTGKTTNAINLATYLSRLKKRIILVETDPNYTINSLRQLELFKLKKKEDTYFPIVGSEDHRVAKEIKKLTSQNKFDYIIVDSAGKTTDNGIKELCLASDLVLITTSLTQNDLLVAYQTVKDLQPAQMVNKQLKICVLPNRIHSRTRVRTVKEVLKNLDTNILNTYVPQRKVFTSPSTIKPEWRYRNIAKEIIKIVNNGQK